MPPVLERQALLLLQSVAADYYYETILLYTHTLQIRQGGFWLYNVNRHEHAVKNKY